MMFIPRITLLMKRDDSGDDRKKLSTVESIGGWEEKVVLHPSSSECHQIALAIPDSANACVYLLSPIRYLYKLFAILTRS